MSAGEKTVAEVMSEASRNSRSGLRWRNVAIVAVVVLVAAGGWLWWQGARSAAAPRYTTEAAVTGDLKVAITATGTIEPTNQVDISSELSGTVKSVNVDYNDKVTKGEVLAELDLGTLQATVESSRANVSAQKANLTSAEASLDDAQAAFDRMQSLRDTNNASTRDMELATSNLARARASVEVAKANVAVAEATLKVNEANLAKGCICSPIDGVVLARNVEPGQIVASSFQAPTLFSIAENLAHMQLEVDIDEADIGQVKTGDEATFTVEAWQGRTFNARIEQLRFAPAVVDGVVTYKAILSVDNSDLALRPGMTATADITVNEVDGALLVPNSALRFTPVPVVAQGGGLFGGFTPPPAPQAETGASGSHRVYVLRNGAPVAVSVETGATDGKQTVIAAGDLKAGDQVITGTETAP
ncbi:MAG TPA: efflux RND transporter periplasmic adaptor subunit [Devosiaceae bacterium]